ncbi:uncharacterized protein LOC125469340 isoform X1 [Pyrus x bretschneideri]|uniref:uncharacterized protein LOC125469340 isoform X1 n=2 Tax=Pyrus x bretschneideri TaxID=225117 RepID=UPI00202DF778|nr:uncharacterized protein LOC125469340 isoform X1 [Pyrus x bretschneideri]XP_048422517.1 uncharacterized protein LOC125469340 isoform X1 [Pyrus x bretschneideri]XP_048422518.1 uncharacterized protein LOC125469340 isoform X1 [Pyrus x bretschneideri]XP_048422519.1 uncharacterized protein LOC125469340 isoform X1 [Pyrus x bretschneideri]
MGSEKESENGELPDLEKQRLGGGGGGGDETSLLPNLTTVDVVPPLEQVVVSGGAFSEVHEPPTATAAVNFSEEVPSPKKDHLSRTSSSHEQCRVCQQEKDQVLIDLGCQCRGRLAKSHRSCTDTWFRTRGTNGRYSKG